MFEEIPPTNTLSQKDENPSTLKHGQISLDVMQNPLKGYVKQSIYIVALWTPTSHLTTIANHSFLLKVD
jgi:hypothetical protein